jgi:histidyl-tRNA synthetase
LFVSGCATARFAAIVGDQELGAGTITLRRLADGRQNEFGLDEAVTVMRSREDPA